MYVNDALTHAFTSLLKELSLNVSQMYVNDALTHLDKFT